MAHSFEKATAWKLVWPVFLRLTRRPGDSENRGLIGIPWVPLLQSRCEVLKISSDMSCGHIMKIIVKFWAVRQLVYEEYFYWKSTYVDCIWKLRPLLKCRWVMSARGCPLLHCSEIRVSKYPPLPNKSKREHVKIKVKSINVSTGNFYGKMWDVVEMFSPLRVNW